MKLRRFFRTPKGEFLLVLLVVGVPAAVVARLSLAGPVVAAAVVSAMLVDAPLLRFTRGRWAFPSGALLTGLIVGMVLSQREPWYAAAITAVVGIVAKYIARIRTANVFNPAALGLVATFYPLHTGQSWWGALPDAHPAFILLLLATGAFVAVRFDKVAAVVAFLAVYFTLFTITTFVGDPARFVSIYRAPDLHAALYFAFFMLTDPPTSPPKARDQLAYSAIVGAACYAIFELTGAAYFLPAGLLAGNVWEAWRRWAAHRQRMTGKSLAPRVAPL